MVVHCMNSSKLNSWTIDNHLDTLTAVVLMLIACYNKTTQYIICAVYVIVQYVNVLRMLSTMLLYK